MKYASEPTAETGASPMPRAAAKFKRVTAENHQPAETDQHRAHHHADDRGRQHGDVGEHQAGERPGQPGTDDAQRRNNPVRPADQAGQQGDRRR